MQRRAVIALAACVVAGLTACEEVPYSRPRTQRAITGTVTQVFDGAPIPGVRVELGDLATTTDAHGAYRLEGAVVGTYALAASKRDYATAAREVAVLDETRELEHDFALVYLPPRVDVSGAARSGAFTGQATWDWSFCGIRVIDEQGDATIASVEAYAGIPGFRHVAVPLAFNGAWWGGDFRMAAGSVTADDFWGVRARDAEGHETLVRVPLGPCAGLPTLSGAVTWLRDGSPLPGVVVRLGVHSDTTDTQGRYELAGLPPGEHMLTAARSGFDSVATEITVPISPSDQAHDFAMTHGAPWFDLGDAGVRHRGNGSGCLIDNQFCGIRIHDDRGDHTITRVVAYSFDFGSRFSFHHDLEFDGDTWSGTFRMYGITFRQLSPYLTNLAAFDEDGHVALRMNVTGNSCTTLEPIERIVLLHMHKPGESSPYLTRPLVYDENFVMPLGESARIEFRSNFDPWLTVTLIREKRYYRLSPINPGEDVFVFQIFVYCSRDGVLTLAGGDDRATHEGTLPFILNPLDPGECPTRLGFKLQAVCEP